MLRLFVVLSLLVYSSSWADPGPHDFDLGDGRRATGSVEFPGDRGSSVPTGGSSAPTVQNGTGGSSVGVPGQGNPTPYTGPPPPHVPDGASPGPNGTVLWPAQQPLYNDFSRTLEYTNRVPTSDIQRLQANLGQLRGLRNQIADTLNVTPHGTRIPRDHSWYQPTEPGRTQSALLNYLDQQIAPILARTQSSEAQAAWRAIEDRGRSIQAYEDNPPRNPCLGCDNPHCTRDFVRTEARRAQTQFPVCTCSNSDCINGQVRLFENSIRRAQPRHLTSQQRLDRIRTEARPLLQEYLELTDEAYTVSEITNEDQLRTLRTAVDQAHERIAQEDRAWWESNTEQGTLREQEERRLQIAALEREYSELTSQSVPLYLKTGATHVQLQSIQNLLAHTRSRPLPAPIERPASSIDRPRVDLTQLPDPELSTHVLEQLHSPPGEFRDGLIRQCRDLSRVLTSSEFPIPQAVAQGGLLASGQSDVAYTSGRFGEATFFRDLGRGCLNLSTGQEATPFERSIHSFFSTRELDTGRELTQQEISGAFVDMVERGGQPLDRAREIGNAMLEMLARLQVGAEHALEPIVNRGVEIATERIRAQGPVDQGPVATPVAPTLAVTPPGTEVARTLVAPPTPIVQPPVTVPAQTAPVLTPERRVEAVAEVPPEPVRVETPQQRRQRIYEATMRRLQPPPTPPPVREQPIVRQVEPPRIDVRQDGVQLTQTLERVDPPQPTLLTTLTTVVEPVVEAFCFPGETPICMQDRQSRRIDSVRVGDFVESFDVEQRVASCRRVERIFERTVGHLTILTFGERTLRTTDNHPFYLPETHRWVEARQLKVGDELQTVSRMRVRIEAIGGEFGNFRVYNFGVEGTRTYYAEDILVHNCGGEVQGVARNLIGAVGGGMPFAIPLPTDEEQRNLVRGLEIATAPRDPAPLDDQALTTTLTPDLPQTTVQTPILQGMEDPLPPLPVRQVAPLGRTETPIENPLVTPTTERPIMPVDPRGGIVERLPRTNGTWSGIPGNSDWTSTLPEVNTATGGAPIPFRDNYPDFSQWAQERFSIDGLTGINDHDFRLADERLADVRHFESTAAAERYRIENGLTWHHHQDTRTMELVPSDLNNRIPHDGGAAELRRRNQQ